MSTNTFRKEAKRERDRAYSVIPQVHYNRKITFFNRETLRKSIFCTFPRFFWTFILINGTFVHVYYKQKTPAEAGLILII
ncbi:hypothetical protein phiLC3p49 [Lactococcus phage phiLC3]|uniref:hypothetical protein n=1 Tax=Lactococcus phage phiLC3 TaxID=12390 RepID=UPI000034E68E|nr:hypothetical protein phiLC3p49 [Lactococcus phage phiLC3]AAS66826.1 unknown [Lactococcus phage phiLC3]